jgi:uncharacterized membrane protein
MEGFGHMFGLRIVRIGPTFWLFLVKDCSTLEWSSRARLSGALGAQGMDAKFLDGLRKFCSRGAERLRGRARYNVVFDICIICTA